MIFQQCCGGSVSFVELSRQSQRFGLFVLAHVVACLSLTARQARIVRVDYAGVANRA